MEDLKRMVTRSGFSEVFWERIQADRRKGGRLTFRACYAERGESFKAASETLEKMVQTFGQMELEYEAEYGEPKYPSYEAFRKARERMSRHR